MRRHPALAVLLSTAALVAAGLSPAGGVPSPAPAPGPDGWTGVSTGTVGIIREPSLYRSADQSLHVLYSRDGATTDDLVHAAIASTGAVSSTAVVTGWSTVESTPVLIAGPAGGLRAVFGGLRTSSSDDPFSTGAMNSATAPASGDSWTLQSTFLTTSTTAYGSYGTAATTLADGTPVVAFPLNSTITWNAGGADASFTVDQCCAYDLGMARSGSAVWVGWYGNGGTEATDGVFVRQILPALGPIQKAPGSSARSTGKVAMAVRPNGEVYTAYCSGYPTCTEVRLWQVGASATTTVPGSVAAQTMGLSAAPNGELWVAWADAAGDVRAVRTYDAMSRFGSVVDAGRPAGTTSVYSLALSGVDERADVVVNNGSGLWHRQAIAAPPAAAPPPALGLKASPKSWRAGKATQVRFTVTSGGAKVVGARVTVGKRTCTTTATGTCTVTFSKKTKPGRLRATATRVGYQPVSIKLTVKKAKKK